MRSCTAAAGKEPAEVDMVVAWSAVPEVDISVDSVFSLDVDTEAERI